MVEETVLGSSSNCKLTAAAMLEQGLDPNSEEAQEQINPDNLKSLPEIECSLKRDYRSMIEEWAYSST